MDLKEAAKETVKESFREKVLTDENIDFMQEQFMPVRQMMANYECAIMEIETKFNVLNKRFSLEYDRNPIETIKTRVKSLEGIAKKARKRGVPFTIESIEENIRDIAGVRVICSFQEDIYLLAKCLLQQEDVTLVEEKDYIKNPKPSGYRSLHLIVQVPIFLENERKLMYVEIQLRTIAMDFWASLEHKLRYKKAIPDSMLAELSDRLLHCADVISELDEEMEEIRRKIYSVLED